MNDSYNCYLVSLSFGLAVVASYTMLNVAARVRTIAVKGKQRHCWLLGGALATGGGIWSMHFMGMLACRMTIRMNYDPLRTGLSFVLAVGVAYVALRLTTSGELDHRRMSLGASVMAAGIAGMHYLGMAAMLVEPRPTYRLGFILLSILIAFGTSWTALRLAFTLRDGTRREMYRQRIGASLLMGFAIAAIHYTGMYAAVFGPGTRPLGTGGISVVVLVVLMSLFSLGGLAISLVFAVLDGRIDRLLLPVLLPIVEPTEETVQRLNALHGLDPVTGIGSRATFLLALEQKMSEAKAAGQLLGLVFLDMDGFKSINDSHGYSGGDALLRAFSDDLRRRVRVETTLGRLGGDEFALVLEGFEEPDKVEPMARSILERIRTEFEVEGTTIKITASAGIAIYPRDGSSVDTLLKSANVAMHAAKELGKNSFCVFDPSMSKAMRRKLKITQGLAEALAKNQFSLVFQPKFDGGGSRMTGAEALIRWIHPEMGNIPPMDFIPLAEETGQIVAISEWVIREVCWQIISWRNMGLAPVRVAINLSPEQLRIAGYAERIYSMVRAATVSPDLIMFEITETAAMREPKLASEAIREFQKAGFDFAIDDFGTGYSSMAYLQQFRVKELKIDRFFVNSMEDGGGEGQTIVSAIIALAHALHMTVVAEGVETNSQLTKLRGMDCDEVQGYLLGRPLVPGDFEKLLRANTGDQKLAEVSSAQSELSRTEGQNSKQRVASDWPEPLYSC